MKKGKFLSSLAALAISASMLLAPAANAFAAEPDVNPGETPAVEDNNETGDETSATTDEKTNDNVATINIHKIRMDADKLSEWKPEEHTNNGEKITDITGWFGDNSKEVAGVVFEVYKEVDAGTKNAVSGEELNKSYPFDKIDKTKAYLKVAEKKTEAKGTGNIDLTSELDKDGNNVKDTNFIIVENLGKSNYEEKDEEGNTKTLSKEGKAIPALITLPAVVKGDVLNLYPKNTTANQPKVDKDFEGKANAKQDRLEITGKDAPIVKDVKVGDEVPYDIETLIPEGAKYKTVAWTDQMTEGLTFNNDVKIMIGAKGSEEEWDAANYTVKEDGNGFVLELTEAGLKALEEKAKDAEVRLLVKYSATVNENAKVERPERNDVIFHYGNEPHHGNTPYPTKPNDKGELTVTKDFPDVEGDWVKGEKVEVTLIDAHTGKPAEKLPDGQTAKVTLDIDNKTHKWTGLDKDKQYKVVETFIPGDEVTYVKQEDGSVKIEDRITDNPTPLNPEEPAVVTYGHRFQKIDQSTKKGLKDAEFVVKNGNGQDAKYLKEKDNKTKKFEQAAYAKAEKEYKDAVKEAKEDAKIAELKEARDKAYVTVNTQWEFTGTSKDDAYVFKSDVDGYFKVTGLNKGEYYLEEKKAPKGYAEIKEAQKFTVDEGSTGETTLETDELKDEVGFLQINNKKVTIPQTGGIGSLIFVVAGLALMAVAFVAMKRRNSYEA